MAEGHLEQVERARSLSRLAELGVPEDALRDAAHVGVQHGFSCTRHDPPSLGGILTWAKAVRHLRDLLVPDGWWASDTRNYATVVSPEGTVALAVAGGDKNTGNPKKLPATRTEKGPATQQAVHENQLSMEDLSESFPKGRQTWMLLHYVDVEAQEIRLELSLPAAMTGGYVDTWRERVYLRPIPFDAEPFEGSEAEAEEIEITVNRRAG
jgi:hypothetical protein